MWVFFLQLGYMLAIPLNPRLRQKENYTMDALEFVVSRFYLPLRHFPRLGSAHQVFILHVLQSCASSLLFSALLSASCQF